MTIKNKQVQLLVVAATAIALLAITIFIKSYSNSSQSETESSSQMAASERAPQPSPNKDAVDLAPDFSLVDSKRQILKLSDLRGKVVVINFWATWCGPCRDEIPGFIEVYEKYKPRGLEIVGISLDQGGWPVVDRFIKNFNLPYPVVMGDLKVVMDYGGVQVIPTTFFVNRNGRVAYAHRGYFPKELFAEKIKELL
jgi:peroxiredoxin